MPTCANSFGQSTRAKQAAERAYYARWSENHPPKERISLVDRFNELMEQKRFDRETKGFSEDFLTRRRFPVLGQTMNAASPEL